MSESYNTLATNIAIQNSRIGDLTSDLRDIFSKNQTIFRISAVTPSNFSQNDIIYSYGPQKQLCKKKLQTLNILMDSLHKYTEEDKEHIYHQVVSQLPWLLGLWGELIVLLGVVILRIMT